MISALNNDPEFTILNWQMRSFLEVTNEIIKYLGLQNKNKINYIPNPFKDRYQFKTLLHGMILIF